MCGCFVVVFVVVVGLVAFCLLLLFVAFCLFLGRCFVFWWGGGFWEVDVWGGELWEWGGWFEYGG